MGAVVGQVSVVDLSVAANLAAIESQAQGTTGVLVVDTQDGHLTLKLVTPAGVLDASNVAAAPGPVTFG